MVKTVHVMSEGDLSYPTGLNLGHKSWGGGGLGLVSMLPIVPPDLRLVQGLHGSILRFTHGLIKGEGPAVSAMLFSNSSPCTPSGLLQS